MNTIQNLSGLKISTSTERYKGLSLDASRKKLFDSYKALVGKKFFNRDLGIYVELNRDAVNKLSYGSKIYIKKLALLDIVDDLIHNMKYCNFGKKKVSDKITVIGYFNFKCSILIDKIPEELRIAVQVRTDGKFYYSQEVLIIKK